MPTDFRTCRSTPERVETRPFLDTHDVESGNDKISDLDSAISTDDAASVSGETISCHCKVGESQTVSHSVSKIDRLPSQRRLSCAYIRQNEPGMRSRLVQWIIRSCQIVLLLLGSVQAVGLILSLAVGLLPQNPEQLFRGRASQKADYRTSHWPTDYTSDILPVRCHSHNDYWRTIPLMSAIRAGCTGVEADVWLYNDDDLFVGHSRSSLTRNRTLRSLYIDPLLEILEKQNPTHEFLPSRQIPRNGVFDVDADRTLVLLIDFKTMGDDLWPVVRRQLEPLREKLYLSYFNGTDVIPGPITVVATGNAPFHCVIANMTYRDVFFDAPLAEMAQIPPNQPSPPARYDSAEEQAYLNTVSEIPMETFGRDLDRGQGYSGVGRTNSNIYTKYNSYYVSTSFKASIGWPLPYLTAGHRAKIEAQIKGAHAQGLQVRYWDVPAWPVSWRNYLWRELISAGVDYLNVDDLESASKGQWRSEGSYGRAIWGEGDW